MNRDMWATIDNLFEQKLLDHDPALDAALENSEKAELPPISVSASHGKMLQLLARIRGASSILELGTLGGYSTIWLARGLSNGGQLVSLEASEKHADVARKNIEHAGLSEKVEIIIGPALDSLPTLVDDDRAPFDLVFIDADKPNNPAYIDWALKLTRPGSVIIVDNVVRGGRIIEPNNDDASVQGTLAVFDLVENEPRLDATAIQTVGAKGYDGMLIALVVE